jgi:hypothetical protein
MKSIKATTILLLLFLGVGSLTATAGPVVSSHYSGGVGHYSGGVGHYSGGYHGGYYGGPHYGYGFGVGLGVGLAVDALAYGYYPYGYYPYGYYPYAAAPVVVQQAAPVYMEQGNTAPAQPQSAAPAGQSSNDWYYCRDPAGYYPYVRSCANGWQRVPAQPQN